MFILKDLLIPLQEQFSDTKQGQKRKICFVYTLLAVVIPFTSSLISNLLLNSHKCSEAPHGIGLYPVFKGAYFFAHFGQALSHQVEQSAVSG